MARLLVDARTHALREGWPRAVATLIGTFGDIDLAEEAATDAVAEAERRWPEEPPPEPCDWIVRAAHEVAVGRIRREATSDPRYRELLPRAEEPPDPRPADAELALFFTCCHPALPEAARVALTLRLLAGLSTAEIAETFRVSEATMEQRLERAKARIRDHHLPYRVPGPPEWHRRLGCVLGVVHLVFTEGYLAAGREDLAGEAVRLGRILLDLFPDEPEVRGLLALMLLIRSRREARAGEDGTLVPLGVQDRTLWHRDEIDEGRFLLRQCQRLDRPGPYQVQATLQAVHCDAASAEDTDWTQIVALYDHLMLLEPSDVVALNRAVAVAEVEGAETALAAVERLDLDTHLYHAVRADLLTRLDRPEEADHAWTAAVSRVRNETEHAYLRDQVSR